jgi:hypothetical protein
VIINQLPTDEDGALVMGEEYGMQAEYENPTANPLKKQRIAVIMGHAIMDVICWY